MSEQTTGTARPDHHADVRWFSDLGLGDLEQVGGKNASLGEMVSHLSDLGVRVPNGFATTADAFHRFIGDTGLAERISGLLADLDTDDVRRLAEVGREIREAVVGQPFPEDLEAGIRAAYDALVEESTREGADAPSFAVRSSATAEDLPDASFAGQQETFLNVRGIDEVLQAVREVYASLYNDRAIAYRVHHDFAHDAVGISAGVQRMVRSDIGSSGVMFTMDTESGFTDAVFITSAFGLGEGVVQGAVNPDEFYVYKPALRAGRPAVLKRSVGGKATQMVYTQDTAVGRTTEFVDVEPARSRLLSLTDDEVTELARHALVIEEHYGRPMDIEWGKDGVDGHLYVLQARPETVQSRRTGALERYAMDPAVAKGAEVLVEGRAIGQKIGSGAVRVLTDIDQMHEFVPGEVLVADMTDPDWEPIMKRASAIVTNRGGRTCHAAIIARELGIPAVVGTGGATRSLTDGREVTVTCAEGDTGLVYEGLLDFEVERTELDSLPEVPVKIMMNVGTPEQAFAFSRLPNQGVGLARLEFIINRQIGIHPRALLELESDPDALPADLRGEVEEMIAAYPSPREFFVQRVVEGVATIAAAFAPEPVIVRMSDFKSNEYANLVGGERYEPEEENPMIGYRGSRYLSEDFAGVLRDGVRGAAPRARRDGPDQRLGDDPVRAHPQGGPRRHRAARQPRARARRERPQGRDDVRGALQRGAGRAVPRALRRLLDRLQRHDPADPGSGPRLRPGRRRLRRARPGGAAHARAGHQGLQEAGQVRRHLRPGPLRPPRPRAVAAGAGHRVDVAEPRHSRGHLAAPRGRRDRLRLRWGSRGSRGSVVGRSTTLPRCLRPAGPAGRRAGRPGCRPGCRRARPADRPGRRCRARR